jgi:histidinol-phosphate aminotransferase
MVAMMETLIRAAVRDLAEYAPPQDENENLEIRADRNEAALPAPDHVLAALRSLDGRALSRYPTGLMERVANALARRLDVCVDRLATGCGADDLLAALGRALLDPGDVVVTVTPTFATYAWLTAVAGARLRCVSYDRRWQLDLDALISAARGAKLVILGHPNNPTGDTLSFETIALLSRALAGSLIVVDEVYLALSRDSLVPALSTLHNVAVVGSLSKVAALAGARVGYAVARPPLARALRCVMPPFPIGVASLAAAHAYLRGGSATAAFEERLAVQVRRSLDAIVAEAGRLAENVWRGSSNFVLMDFGANAAPLAAALRARGIAVRSFREPELVGCLRFCALDDPSTTRFCASIREAAAELTSSAVYA